MKLATLLLLLSLNIGIHAQWNQNYIGIYAIQAESDAPYNQLERVLVTEDQIHLINDGQTLYSYQYIDQENSVFNVKCILSNGLVPNAELAKHAFAIDIQSDEEFYLVNVQFKGQTQSIKLRRI